MKKQLQQKNEELSQRKDFDTLLKLLKLEFKRSSELIKKLEEEKLEAREEMNRQKRRYIRKKFVYGFCIVLMFCYIVKLF